MHDTTTVFSTYWAWLMGAHVAWIVDPSSLRQNWTSRRRLFHSSSFQPDVIWSRSPCSSSDAFLPVGTAGVLLGFGSWDDAALARGVFIGEGGTLVAAATMACR